MKNYNNWQKDLQDSVIALNGIQHTILPCLITGRIHTIESQQNDVLILMDRLSGIDYIRENKQGLQGIAARCQWGKAWNTFTIRFERHTGSDTEFTKRNNQIKEGYFYPAFTLQAYFNNRADNVCISASIIRTTDLYLFIKENFNNKKLVHEKSSDNRFLYVFWEDLKTFPIKTYKKP